jgi:hypothetical protein
MCAQPPIPRRLLACVLLWFVAVIMTARSSAAPVTLYETTFENFNPNLDLAGQNQWISNGVGGNGLVLDYIDAQSGYIGYGPPPSTNGLYVWRPVNHNPTNLPIVTVTLDMEVIDSTTSNYDEFRWSVYNIAGDRLFSLIFDNRDWGIYRQLDNDQFEFDGWGFETNTIYTVELRMNFASNRWDVWVGGEQIVTNELITTQNAPRTFGDVDAVWLRGGAVAGNNFMVFDNLKITAEAIAVPPPAPPVIQPLLAFGGGQYLIRVTGTEDVKFAVEGSTNLLNWVSLKTNVISGGYFEHLDTTAAGLTRRFYRARWVP